VYRSKEDSEDRVKPKHPSCYANLPLNISSKERNKKMRDSFSIVVQNGKKLPLSGRIKCFLPSLGRG
jgi:hypothetical protein